MAKLSLKTKIVSKASESPSKPLSDSGIVSSVVVRRKPKIEVFAPPKPVPESKAKPEPITEPIKPKKKAEKVKKPPPPPQPKKKKKIVEEVDPRPRSERVAETLTILTDEFPHLFAVTDAELLPLAIGIRKDLWNALKEKKAEGKFRSRALIGEAIAIWKAQHPQYLELLKIAGTPRRGLDGEPQGAVSEEEAQRAQTSPCTF